MTTTHTLSLRKTHKYVGTYRDLDKWEDIGTVTELASATIHVDEEDPCETTVTRIFVCAECPEPRTDAEIENALHDVYSSHGCAHEYDCCGCWSTSVVEVKKHGAIHEVVTSSSRNY